MAINKKKSSATKKVKPQSNAAIKAQLREANRQVAKLQRELVKKPKTTASLSKQAKQVKREVKGNIAQSGKTFKEAVRSFSKLKKTIQDSRELSRIEKLLGEDFDTLAQARRELRKQSKIVKPKSTKKVPSPQSKSKASKKQSQKRTAKKTQPFSPQAQSASQSKQSSVNPPAIHSTEDQREFNRKVFRRKKGEDIYHYLLRLEAESDEIKSITGKWYFKYMGGRSKITYGTISEMVAEISTYELTQIAMSGDDVAQRDLFKSIRFEELIGVTPLEYVMEKRSEEEEARKRRNNARNKELRALRKRGYKVNAHTRAQDLRDIVFEDNQKLLAELEQMKKSSKRRSKK